MGKKYLKLELSNHTLKIINKLNRVTEEEILLLLNGLNSYSTGLLKSLIVLKGGKYEEER